MSADRLEWLSSEYDRLETEHLTLIRVGADRAVLLASARAVSAAADAFNAEAYRKYYAKEDAWMSLDLLTERTEVLQGLWQDMAFAYAGLLPDGQPMRTTDAGPPTPERGA